MVEAVNELEFTITFHGPFHVATGGNRDGIATIDPDEPLPATSLKGVMRATAKRVLGKDSRLVKNVFGSGRTPTPWRWSPAVPDEQGWESPQPAARVSIDPATSTARPDMLAFSEHTQAAHASFRITQHGGIREEDLATHRALLAISGQATRSIGALRRRGLGWVSIRCTTHEPDAADVQRILKEHE